MPSIEADFQAELAQIQAESIGWIPLEEGAYLHLGSDEFPDNTVREIVDLAFPQFRSKIGGKSTRVAARTVLNWYPRGGNEMFNSLINLRKSMCILGVKVLWS